MYYLPELESLAGKQSVGLELSEVGAAVAAADRLLFEATLPCSIDLY